MFLSHLKLKRYVNDVFQMRPNYMYVNQPTTEPKTSQFNEMFFLFPNKI